MLSVTASTTKPTSRKIHKKGDKQKEKKRETATFEELRYSDPSTHSARSTIN